MLSIIILSSCDGGWQKQIDDRDKQILELTIQNLKLIKSYDSLKVDYIQYVNRQSDFIDEMIVEHNKCVHPKKQD